MSEETGVNAPETPHDQATETPTPELATTPTGWWKRLPRAARVGIPVAAGATLLIIVVAIVVASLTPSRFEAALTDCDLEDQRSSILRDAGRTLLLDMEGEDVGSGILGYDDVACVLFALDAPSSTLSLMDSTRALDGRQTDSWDGIQATWSYHPDSGLDVILELE